MNNENPEKLTYKQVWDNAFKGYDLKETRLKEIFDPDPDYTRRLNEYGSKCALLSPDVDEELKSLGFDKVDSFEIHGCIEDVYCNNWKQKISISHDVVTVVSYNGEKESFESDIVGEVSRMIIKWLKERVVIDKGAYI